MRNLYSLLLGLALLLAPLAVSAQLPWPTSSPNPDSYGYTWKTNSDPTGPAYIWEDISAIGTEVLGLNDDGNVGPIPMGISFPYYWYTREELWIADNGFLAFTATPIGSSAIGFPPTPTPSQPNDVIAPYMSDMNPTGPGNPGKVYYYSDVANNRFIVTWENMPYWVPPATSPNQYSGSNSFQVILDGNDSTITFNYKELTGDWAASYNNANYPFVTGIENVTGTFGLMAPNLPNANPVGQRPVASTSIRFYPPASPSNVRDIAVTNVQNDEVQAFFVPWEPSGPFTTPNFALYGGITNVGNVDILTDIPVLAQVKDANGILFYQARDTANAGLFAGETTYFKFPLPFYPPKVGPFIYTVSLESPQIYADINGTNNQRTNEAVVIDTTLEEVAFTYSSGDFNNLLETNGGGVVSWSGNTGNSGAGAYYESYGYPITITALEYYSITSGTGAGSEGFLAQIFGKDTTTGAVPGPLLFEKAVLNADIPQGPATPATPWTRVEVDPPVVINSDGFYVSWIQRTDSCVLFTEGAEPISNRSFEVLGGGWSIYRSNTTDELWIRAIVNIEDAAILPNTSISKQLDGLEELKIYPNPSEGIFSVETTWKQAQPVELKVMDVQGRKMYRQQIAPALNWNERMDLRHLTPGVYLLQVSTPEGSTVRRLFIQ